MSQQTPSDEGTARSEGMPRQTPSEGQLSDSSEGQDREFQLGDIAAAFGVLITLSAAWLYMAGWSYAYHYFGHFHIGLLPLDIPRETFFVYGSWVLKSHAVWGIALIVIGVAVSLVMPWGRLGRARRLLSWLGLVVVLGVFWLGYEAAVETARSHYLQDRAEDYPAHPRARIWVDPEWLGKGGAVAFKTGLAAGCYRLLLESHESLFLFRPFRDAPAAAVPLVILPRGEVKALRLLADYTSCP